MNPPLPPLKRRAYLLGGVRLVFTFQPPAPLQPGSLIPDYIKNQPPTMNDPNEHWILRRANLAQQED